MRIRDVELIALRSELPAPAVFSWGAATARNVGIVRVTTDDGLTGLGETSVTFPLWSLEERVLTVASGLRPLVLGRPVDDIPTLIDELNATFGRLGPLWSPAAIQATIGAFEVALWDLAAQAAGLPLYRLINPQADTAPVPLYAVGLGGTPPQVAEQAGRALAEDYTAVKVRAGFGRERDAALLDALAGAGLDMARVLVDANMAWSAAEARELAPWVGSYGVGWLEEPVVWYDYVTLAELRATAGVPIAAGENAFGRAEVDKLVDLDAADIVMPDIARCGGLTNARRMVQRARAKGRPYSPHQYASDVGFVACLHLCLAEPGTFSVLRDVSDWPLRTAVVEEPARVAGGCGHVPDRPGLGVTLAEAAIAPYRL